MGAQRRQQAPDLGEEIAEPPLEHGASRPRGADEDGVEPALADEAGIVGKGRRHMQVEAARARLQRQVFGLHLHVAIADQRDVEPPAADGQTGERPRLLRRPIVLRALAAAVAEPVEHGGGVAGASLVEFARQGGGLGLGVKFGQKAALDQSGDGPGERFRLLDEARGEIGEFDGQFTRRREGVEQRRRLRIDRQPQRRDGVNDERAPRVERQDVDEGGAAQQHGDEPAPASRREAGAISVAEPTTQTVASTGGRFLREPRRAGAFGASRSAFFAQTRRGLDGATARRGDRAYRTDCHCGLFDRKSSPGARHARQRCSLEATPSRGRRAR